MAGIAVEQILRPLGDLKSREPINYTKDRKNEIGVIMNDREKCLREACEIVNGARNQAYGNVEDNFDRIASLWSIYLDTAVTPIDVAMMMVLLKAARVSTGGVSHYDNYVDVAGYAACAYEITKEWNGESDESNRENLVRAN